MKVTESNKRDYLNLVADYRLAKCIKNEIASFKKGSEYFFFVFLLPVRNLLFFLAMFTAVLFKKTFTYLSHIQLKRIKPFYSWFMSR